MSEEKSWSRYGLTELAWSELSLAEREVHYRRAGVCEHKYVYPGVAGNLSDDRLSAEYSFDPYFHTGHMVAHRVSGGCDCQMCALKIGVARGR